MSRDNLELVVYEVPVFEKMFDQIEALLRELSWDLEQSDRPFYLRLSESLRRAMESGQLRPGELIPSTRQLASACGVHRHTVMNALGELVSQGWLESEQGRGYRVVKGLPRYFSTDQPPATDSSLSRRTFRYAFPSGQPDLRLFPRREYSAILREVVHQSDPMALLGYADPSGNPELREQLAHYLRRMRDLRGGDILITNGSQEGIFLVGSLLLSPGALVAVEESGYAPAWEALRLTGGRLVGLRVDGHGVDPQALEELARREKVCLLYITPLHQYPSTVTMPVERRRELYEVCARHRIPILEDDYDHEFHYRSRPLTPLKSSDSEGLVYYTSTFSKVVYPSARLGFLVPPPGRAAELARLKKITTRQSNTLVQLTQARWMANGGFERHLRRMRRTYQNRMGVMCQMLDRGRESYGLKVSYQPPDGGMSLWVDFGLDTAELAVKAVELGVGVRAGSEYRLDAGPSTHLRLGFASSSEEEIREGLDLLFKAAQDIAG